MQIETKIAGERAILSVSGRLDASWAEHFHGTVQETIRDGHHHVRIDASGLDYLSSAGIRSLLRIQRELAAVKGSFGIIRAAGFVADTLRLSGLEQLMVDAAELSDAETPGRTDRAPVDAVQSVGGIRFETHLLAAQGKITVRSAGRWNTWSPVLKVDAEEISFPKTVFGLGIGAPGKDADAARPRFGEFVAAAGHVAWLPGDGSDTPDYLEQAERFVPRLHVIQSLTGEGDFSHLIRFSPEEKGACLNLSDLFLRILQTTRSNAAAMVGLAEVEGLVGTALSRSPGLIQPSDHPSDFPEMRNWLSFSGERVHRQAQALVVAFLSRNPSPIPGVQLLPLTSQPELRSHTHAVILPYRPLQQGVPALEPAVRSLFGDNGPIGLLHLIEDGRPAVGLGQSAFIRGTCWCAPLHVEKEPTV